MTPRYRPVIRSSAFWRVYFEDNRVAPRPVPWQLGATLATVEREQVASSLAEFQLGESSEGRHLLHAASQYAQREEDTDYLAAMRLFIAEEQRHARELGQFLDLAGIPRKLCTISDTAFRHSRRGSGLERSIIVLVTAEIIATVYYAALRDATGSPVLRSLCDLILWDESAHVRFQCERLAMLREKRSISLVKIAEGLQRIFLSMVCIVVWHRHGKAMRAGGLTWPLFRLRVRRVFNRALVYMSPLREAEVAAIDDDQLTADHPPNPAAEL